ncbi:MAG: O-antigen ligase family protein [Candidatus Cloacimonetes bacterium]|nr:O-antigen ligase family protein [Candidatus Cloacimonadota bacterium]
MKIKIFGWSLQLERFNPKTLLLDFLFYCLLLAFFFQTRFALFGGQEVVDYLIPFVYLSDILIILLLVRSFKSLRLLRNRRYFFQAFSFSVFLFSAAISNLSAVHSISAWYHWLKILEFGAFAFWIAWVVSRVTINNQQSTILKFLSVGLVFQCFIAIGEFVLQRSLGLQILGEWRFSILTPGIAKVVLFGKEFLRPYATFPHPNVLGGILAIMAPICLYTFLATTEAQKRAEARKTSVSQRTLQCSQWLQVFYFILFTFVLFLTFSRSAWLTYLVLLAIVLGFWGWKFGGFRGLRKWMVRVLLFTLCSLLFAIPIVYQRIKSLQTTDVLSIERRLELGQAAIAMFRDHPLLGVGLGNFIPNLEKYLVVSGQGRFLQPVHNVPLLILAETGVVGFAAFFLFLAVIFRNFVRKAKAKKEFCLPASHCDLPASSRDLPASRCLPDSASLWQAGEAWRAGALRFAFCVLLMWLGIFITSLFDHYWWTLQAGQLFFWLTVGLTIGFSL